MEIHARYWPSALIPLPNGDYEACPAGAEAWVPGTDLTAPIAGIDHPEMGGPELAGRVRAALML